jgi:hypothetical protein
MADQRKLVLLLFAIALGGCAQNPARRTACMSHGPGWYLADVDPENAGYALVCAHIDSFFLADTLGRSQYAR